jgi:hypothetical protein
MAHYIVPKQWRLTRDERLARLPDSSKRFRVLAACPDRHCKRGRKCLGLGVGGTCLKTHHAHPMEATIERGAVLNILIGTIAFDPDGTEVMEWADAKQCLYRALQAAEGSEAPLESVADIRRKYRPKPLSKKLRKWVKESEAQRDAEEAARLAKLGVKVDNDQPSFPEVIHQESLRLAIAWVTDAAASRVAARPKQVAPEPDMRAAKTPG